MSLSRMAASLAPSPTLALNATARRLRAEGVDVLHLGGGEPIEAAPAAAVAAAQEVLAGGVVRYPPVDGSAELKDAIIASTKQIYSYEPTPKQVAVASGGKQAIMLILRALLDPGDEVVFPTPYWVSYPSMVQLASGAPAPTKPRRERFVPTIDDIEAVFTSRTKALIINSPSNPSGLLYPDELLRDIAALCAARNVYLISDDVYQPLVFAGGGATPITRYASELLSQERLILINAVSKAYAMTGFRVGWAIAPEPIARAVAAMLGHETSGVSTISQQAALGALTGDQSFTQTLASSLLEKRDVLLAELNPLTKARIPPADGGLYVFGDFSAYQPSSTELAAGLLSAARVLTVPGVAFGLDGCLRISFCGPIDQVKEGARRIAEHLNGA